MLFVLLVVGILLGVFPNKINNPDIVSTVENLPTDETISGDVSGDVLPDEENIIYPHEPYFSDEIKYEK